MPQLDFKKTNELLKKYKLSYCKSCLCKKVDEAIKAVKKINYPIVLKISSADIMHKTDFNLVKTDITNEKELENSFKDIIAKAKKKFPKAKIEGIILQEQLIGKEVIIGAKKDPTFGQVIMFGLGGIFVELFKDISFRIAPVNKNLAEEMIEEIKSHKILKGLRGEKSVSINSLVDILIKLSKLIEKEKITEIDFNPVIVNQKTASIVDARIIQ